MQRAVRVATYEVVLKKPAQDPLTYEKPLPLDLIPYQERSDLYRSVGTAFSLGNNTYVTAAHVLLFVVDSQYGAPMIRGADGKVYAIKSISKLSAHEDFAVFSLTSDPSPQGLPINRTPTIDSPVFAVGNALGEGIVLREGLLTSKTPEAQDGRWQWLRFSAAASPGNSGGPLLDDAGQVIGLITAKSPNENLNYALPIANVLDAPVGKARFDMRLLTALPFVQAKKTYTLRDEFALPLDWPSFEHAYQSLAERHDKDARNQLLTEYAETLFPKGPGSETILYHVEMGPADPGAVLQQPNGQWTIQAAQFEYTDLPQDGRVGRMSLGNSVTLLRLQRSAEAATNDLYTDSKAFMDVAAKALDLRRPVGTDSVRITSLGSAVSDAIWEDRYQRKWQQRIWALPSLDMYLVGFLLPTPDGYVALVANVPSPFVRALKDNLAMMADQFTTPYEGTMAQWQAFLNRRNLLPGSLEHAQLVTTPNWRLSTPRFEIAIRSSAMTLDAHSRIVLNMGFVSTGSKVTWEAVGAWWYRDSEKKTYVGLWRQPRPPATARSEIRDAFADLEARRSPYDGKPVRLASDTFSVATTIQAPGSKPGTVSADVLYGLEVQADGQTMPLHLEQAAQSLMGATHILEHGLGSDVTPVAAPSFTSDFEDGLERTRQQLAQYDEQAGKDIRGRTMSADFDDYLVKFAHSADKSAASASTNTPPEAFEDEWKRRSDGLQQYWYEASFVNRNGAVWGDFLSRNGLPSSTPHAKGVTDAENALKSELAGTTPGPSWAERARQLNEAYIDERRRLVPSTRPEDSLSFRSRQNSCPAAATESSGKDKPRLRSVPRSLEEFYPPDVQRAGVEGTVVLAVRVDSAGCPTAAAVMGSSGVAALDDAALKFVETLSFLPAESGGQRIDGEMPMKVAFTLSDDRPRGPTPPQLGSLAVPGKEAPSPR